MSEVILVVTIRILVSVVAVLIIKDIYDLNKK